jgi:Glycosyl hydrolases family 16
LRRASIMGVTVSLVVATTAAAILVGSAPMPASNVAAKRTLVVAVTGKGTVTSRPIGISCPGQCRATFPVSSTVRLVPRPAAEWKFSRWLGACSTTRRCQVTFGPSEAVRAVFTHIPAPRAPPPPPPAYLLKEPFDTVHPARWKKKWWWDGDAHFHLEAKEVQAWRDANVTVTNGIVSLTAKREDVTDFQGRARQFTSGILQSNGIQGGVNAAPRGFTFTYGLIEGRIKAAQGPGMWTGFWLCDDRYVSPWCSREIDIIEIVGTQPNTAHMNFHATDLGINQGSAWASTVPLSDDFHVYAVDWRPDYIAWLIDGVERFRYTGAGIPSNPHYIILNFPVGSSSSWAGTPLLSGSGLPESMEVDWVRVSP